MTKRKSVMSVFVIGYACFLTGCSVQQAESSPDIYQPRTHFLAAGNAGAGRIAFMELQCNECHGVAGDNMKPASPGRSKLQLGSAQARWGPDRLANVIFAPPHAASAPVYRETMTVGQLIDIIAYIKNPSSE